MYGSVILSCEYKHSMLNKIFIVLDPCFLLTSTVNCRWGARKVRGRNQLPWLRDRVSSV